VGVGLVYVCETSCFHLYIYMLSFSGIDSLAGSTTGRLAPSQSSEEDDTEMHHQLQADRSYAY
jgi:hypothetical protein